MKTTDKCPLCGGDKKAGETTYSVDLGYGVVVVRNVPATVCIQCGEEWISAKTGAELERIVENSRKNKLQIEMLRFDKAA